MPAFLTGLLTALVLTALAIFVYDVGYVTPTETAAMPGVHAAQR